MDRGATAARPLQVSQLISQGDNTREVRHKCPLCHGNADELVLLSSAGTAAAAAAALKLIRIFVEPKHTYNSHEAQLGLSAHQDLSQALDSSHLHLDLLWGHGALSHGHI